MLGSALINFVIENILLKYSFVFPGVNVAEALVSKGLAEVVKHRQDDDNR